MILKQLMEHCKRCVNLLNYKETGIKREAHKLKFGAEITDLTGTYINFARQWISEDRTRWISYLSLSSAS
jgi:hypothetical protein